MEVTLTLFQNPSNLQLVLSTSTYVIGKQYSNNEITLILNRTDPFVQYSPSLLIQPEDSKPFTPVSFTHSFTLSNLFTQSTFIDVQIILTSNYDKKYTNPIRLKLIPSLLDNTPLDIQGFFNFSLPISRQTYYVTETDLIPPAQFLSREFIPVPDYVMPPSLLPQPDTEPGISKPIPDESDSSSDNTDNSNPENGNTGNGDTGSWDGGDIKPPVFPVTLQTPLYKVENSNLFVFHNGLLLSPDQYQKVGNVQSNQIILSSSLLSPNDRLEFVTLG